jgi:alkylhydroperoxidase family enzyme
MARIPYYEAESGNEETNATLEKMAPLNIFRMMAHSGKMLDRFTSLGTHILGRTELDDVLREIAIIRVGVLSKASYEVYQHERIGRQIGMSDDLIAAIHEGPNAAAFDEMQALVMQYTDDVVKNVRASDATFNPLSDRLSHKEMQELTLTIGYYMMVSRFLETFDVDIEEEGSTDGVDVTSLK